MAFSAIQFNANALYQSVTQVTHGFAVGDVLRFNGTIFVKAQADSELHAEVVGIVSGLQGADQFFLTQCGFVSGLTTGPYVPGLLHYLSNSNPGELFFVKPTTVGEVELPCFIPYTTDSGFFFASVGTLIQSGPLFDWTTVTSADSPVQMAVNNGYYLDDVAEIDMNLPLTAAVDDEFEIMTINTGGTIITQNNPSQRIIWLDQETQMGNTGGVQLLDTAGTKRGANMRLRCIVANTDFQVVYANGLWDFI